MLEVPQEWRIKSGLASSLPLNPRHKVHTSLQRVAFICSTRCQGAWALHGHQSTWPRPTKALHRLVSTKTKKAILSTMRLETEDAFYIFLVFLHLQTWEHGSMKMTRRGRLRMTQDDQYIYSLSCKVGWKGEEGIHTGDAESRGGSDIKSSHVFPCEQFACRISGTRCKRRATPTLRGGAFNFDPMKSVKRNLCSRTRKKNKKTNSDTKIWKIENGAKILQIVVSLQEAFGDGHRSWSLRRMPWMTCKWRYDSSYSSYSILCFVL